MGGKTRIAKQIAAEIDKVRKPGQLVWDAFCGGLSVSVALSKNGPVLASDACAPLINLYKAVQEGWDPPTEVSKETWQAAKLLPDTDPMKAFCGFGLSYGGAWFCTKMTDRTDGKNPNKFYSVEVSARNSLLRDVPQINSIQLIDFFTVTPSTRYPIIYCDIPYRNTGSYKASPSFDYTSFVNLVQEWSIFSHVFVSEYSFSLGHVVWESLASNSGCFSRHTKPTERLYHIPKQS